MKKWMAAWAALAWASSVVAHHGPSMFDPSALWLKGSIVEFARTNPHSIITLEESSADGRRQRWVLQGEDVRELDRNGISRDFLKAGDVLEVCVFPQKNEFRSSSTESSKLAQAAMLIMPNGRMQIWNPYGKLRGCVRSDDQSQAWVDFVNSSSLARTHWCRQFSTAPRPVTIRQDSERLINEIDSQMSESCK